MCVICYKPSGIDVDMSVLKNCFERNSDGAGVMYAEDGELKVAKGFMKWRSFKRYIKRMSNEKKTELPFVFHFRIATHGSISPPNCHPFHVHENMAMVHNGVMSNIPIDKDSDISDSEAFIQLYVKGLGYDLGMSSTITIEHLEHGSPLNDLFDSFVGSSKLLFMDGAGDVAIVNERLGYWEKSGKGEGMWFSNRMWKPAKLYTVSKTRSHYHGHNHGYGKPVNVGSKLDDVVLELGTAIDDLNTPSKDYYCFTCHLLFEYLDSRRVHWTMGNEKIVCCPDCDSENTVEYDLINSRDLLGV